MAAAALLGAAAMSFVQLVSDRAGSSGSLSRLRSRSRCPCCESALSARDLLPVLGFLLLRGYCRYCRGVIPRRHLLAELAAAGWWSASVVLAGAVWWLPLLLVLPCLAAVAASSAVRGAGWRWIVVALLAPSGVAVLTVGLGAAVQGRWLLYIGCGGTGATALLAAVLMTRDARRVKAPVST